MNTIYLPKFGRFESILAIECRRPLLSSIILLNGIFDLMGSKAFVILFVIAVVEEGQYSFTAPRSRVVWPRGEFGETHTDIPESLRRM